MNKKQISTHSNERMKNSRLHQTWRGVWFGCCAFHFDFEVDFWCNFKENIKRSENF